MGPSQRVPRGAPVTRSRRASGVQRAAPRDGDQHPDREDASLSPTVAAHDPLLELAQLGEVELHLQLRLPHEQDLQQLLGGALEVGEHAHLLEGGHVAIGDCVDIIHAPPERQRKLP